MSLIFIYILEAALAVGIILLLLALIIRRTTKMQKMKLRDASLSSEDIETYAQRTAAEHSISAQKRRLVNWPLPQLEKDYEFLLDVYKKLGAELQNENEVPLSAEWLMDNFHVVEAQTKMLKSELDKKTISRLPVLRKGAQAGRTRLYVMVTELLAHTEGKISEELLVQYCSAYQEESVLFEREIRVLPMMLRLALLEVIRELTEGVWDTLQSWKSADRVFSVYNQGENGHLERYEKQLAAAVGKMPEPDFAFMEHLYQRLRLSGQEQSDAAGLLELAAEQLGVSLQDVTQKSRNAQSLARLAMGDCIGNLLDMDSMDWSVLLASISRVDGILRTDPDGTYPDMTVDTQTQYCRRVEDLAVLWKCSEQHVARQAIALAKYALLNQEQGSSSDHSIPTGHVGYYLISDGTEKLKEVMPKTKRRLISPLYSNIALRKYLYTFSVLLITAVIVAVGVRYGWLTAAMNRIFISVLCGLAIFLPATEIAIQIVNQSLSHIVKPKVFPKMELKHGIPAALSTMVVIPTLLPDTFEAQSIVDRLEEHYLRNREANLYFVLIGSFGDANQKTLPNDAAVIRAVTQCIAALNRKYKAKNSEQKEIFYYCHRERCYNPSNKLWFGWERKRGALLDFNNMITGDGDTGFNYCTPRVPESQQIKYIITLDSDTILPIGMAKNMIGAMAHPLNQPVVDKEKRIVTSGFGLMQPRVEIDIESTGVTLFSKVFTTQSGIDPYTGAVSDVYQDMFDEGIFTGKGIYDLHTFQTVLQGTLPENAVLSHDLLEGSYLRAALVPELMLIDGFPARYSAYAAREHRWTRGDWQLLPFLRRFSGNGKTISENPLSALSKWKMIDNLRRSVLPPAYMLLLGLGLTVLPGNGLVWVLYVLAALLFPYIFSAVSFMLLGIRKPKRSKQYMPVVDGIRSSLLQGLLVLAFLPYQAWMMIKGIFITLARVLVTKQNLLEWTTSAEVESSGAHSLKYEFRTMIAAPLQSLLLLGLALIFRPLAVAFTAPLLILWALSPWLAYHTGKPAVKNAPALSQPEQQELRRIARKTWRFFEEFVGAKNHYLAPDNVQEDPPKGIARRTSPTNIGLGLLSILSARDFGYISTSELFNLVENTVDTLEALPKWNGHLYNWYDTRTLWPLQPVYISTVDSGNFAAYLITLKQGMLEYLESPVADSAFLRGLHDTVLCMNIDTGKALEEMLKYEEQSISTLDGDAAPAQRCRVVRTLLDALEPSGNSGFVWNKKAVDMLKELEEETAQYLPQALLMNCIPEEIEKYCLELPGSETNTLVRLLSANPSLSRLPEINRQVVGAAEKVEQLIKTGKLHFSEESSEWIADVISTMTQNFTFLAKKAEAHTLLLERIDSLMQGIDFAPLYNTKKKLFSIGYELSHEKLTNSHFDLLATEARQASFIAVAKGDVPAEHWFRLGRSLTVVDRYKGLISWTGTMFEYLMPLLVMESYDNTLLDETHSFAVKSQIRFGKMKKIPWGVSESQFASLDRNNDYQYKAIGVPWLALKRSDPDEAVAAPYASFLALGVAPKEAMKNILHLQKEGLEGLYGFYEAADYTPSRLLHHTKRSIVKSYMAHHQGMSLIAMGNTLHENRMVQRFSGEAIIHAYRLLLQEKVPANIVLHTNPVPAAMPAKVVLSQNKIPDRRMFSAGTSAQKVHLLYNGNYSVMITGNGSGYSSTRTAAVSRWREDSTLDPYGYFVYLRDTGSGKVWSAAYAPLNQKPDRYEVNFAADKATFMRNDGDIDTTMEITVASGDNTEIRRITLANNGKTAREIELTSYFEVILMEQSADRAHPAFSNIFMETMPLPGQQGLIAHRRPKSGDNKGLWLANFVVQGSGSRQPVEWESDRALFIGRGNNTKNPFKVFSGQHLSGSVGAVLDPCLSLRAYAGIQAGQSVEISFITITAESRERLESLVAAYLDREAVENAFVLAHERSRIETRYLNISVPNISMYQNILDSLFFAGPKTTAMTRFAPPSAGKGQTHLWPYGISGDYPLVLVLLEKESHISLLRQVMGAQEYWRTLGLRVDLAVVDISPHSYRQPLFSALQDMLTQGKKHAYFHDQQDVFLIEGNQLLPEDLDFLAHASRLVFHGEDGSLEKQSTAPLYKAQYPAGRNFNGKAAPVKHPASQKPELAYFNGLGGFGKNGREYVMQFDSGENTPVPWVNVIANPDFGFVVSESGAGYTWYGNSHEYRLTPWANDAVSDSPGEMLYISDNDTGECWTPTMLPIREEGAYKTRHGFGYSVFSRNGHGVAHKLIQFAASKDAVKISLLRLTNTTQRELRLSVTYYIQPVLGTHEHDTAGHIKTSLGPNSLLLVQNPYNETYPGRVCFLDTSANHRTVTGDRREFFGSGGIAKPDALLRTGLSGNAGSNADPCAAIQAVLTLAPGETEEVVFLLGSASTVEQAAALAKQYRNPEDAAKALRQVKDFWKEELSAVQVETPSDPMGLLLNGWLQYQVLSCRMWARTGLYQSGGAYGFRDQLQDSLAFAASAPAHTREQILLHARHQFAEGDVQHWWHEPSGKGVRTRFSDDLLWLPYVTAEYIRITGDKDILDESAAFIQAPLLELHQDECYGEAVDSGVSATLYRHCTLAVDHSLRFGAHGLPLMGSGDWNDGMNTVGNLGRGESVWLGWFLVTVLEQMVPLCRRMGENDKADTYTGVRKNLIAAIEAHGWDGKWYRRAYFDDGTPLGSSQNQDCKIDSIAQTWSVLSGAALPSRAKTAMASFDEYLVQREDGLIMLLTPPFGEGDSEPGYIKAYFPGIRENGGQYTHAAVWAIMAYAKAGNPEKAEELFNLINPINHTSTFRDYMQYKAEPYVMAADVYSTYPHVGRGGWSWYTGSAGWMYRAGIESILGIYRRGNTLEISPCVPAQWEEYTVRYRHGETHYIINIKRQKKDGDAEEEQAANICPATIQLIDDGEKHFVSLVMLNDSK